MNDVCDARKVVMKPSVFIEEIDRAEQLRRLVLIAHHVLAERPDLREGQKSGVDRKAVAHYVLVLAELVSSEEANACELALLRMCRHKDVERSVRARLKRQGHDRLGKSVLSVLMDRECGPRLMESSHVGNLWDYQPNTRGRLQATMWLAKCYSADDVQERILVSFAEYQRRMV
jgi:hypothetical protein